ncbi:acyl-[acyl-carrier-protein]--UDP-N-acetylglucosamine O-acyltransferase [Bacteroidia bacterium]|nr:acyl-[acyl-carrier-protein]--UDP-N-acetylglucosamine O-acyltransferase [Bacteroidia bacterium]
MNIHSTAIVDPKAKLGNDVKIGPYCIVGAGVVLGDRVELVSHVAIENKTVIGDDTIIYSFAAIGAKGQDLKYQNDEDMTGLRIGKRCRIREYATINQGTPASTGTEIGDDCQIMIHAHIAHDCKIGNNVVLSNDVAIAGHVEIEDNVIISAKSAVHQFCRIGKNSFLGGMSGVGTDMAPYSIYDGIPARYRTINKVGLIRHGFTNEDLHAVHLVYAAAMGDFSDGSSLEERLKKVRKEVNGNKYALDAIDFIENRSTRGINVSSKR